MTDLQISNYKHRAGEDSTEGKCKCNAWMFKLCLRLFGFKLKVSCFVWPFVVVVFHLAKIKKKTMRLLSIGQENQKIFCHFFLHWKLGTEWEVCRFFHPINTLQNILYHHFTFWAFWFQSLFVVVASGSAAAASLMHDAFFLL